MAVVVAVALLGGCSNIFLERRQEDGQVQRLRMDSLDGWNSWDHNFTDKHKEMGVVIKRESTF